MLNSMDSGFNEIKDVKKRRGIRDGSEEVNLMPSRLKLNMNEDRSNSEPPRSFASYNVQPSATRLKPIREKKIREEAGSSDEDGELSKSNSQLNESDFDLEIVDSGSASVSQTPTPTPLAASISRRINSETNLNDSKRRLSGFMGNRSKRFCASTSELSFTSHLDTHKSLFSPKNNALSRQSFNSSLYGSNMSLSSTNSRLFLTNSPFYSGKTMFGGASAYPKRDINQHKILRTPVQMRPSSSLSNSSNTSAKSDNMMPSSNTAKRILEVMNQFSGPLKEARSMGNNINSIIKIPSLVQNRQRYGEEELNFDRSIALSSPSMPYGRPLTGSTSSKQRPESPLLNSSITKPLQIPSMSQLLQMKKLQSNTERVREIASRSDSFLNRNQEYKLPSDDVQNATNTSSSLKMKSNISKNLLRHDKSSVNDQLPAMPINLPNIQLPQLKSIPKFDIQLPPTSNVGEVSSKSQPVKSKATAVPVPAVQYNFQNPPITSLKEKSKVVIPRNDFDLSKPSPLSDTFVDVRSLNHVTQKFILSKPILIDENNIDTQIVAKSPLKSSMTSAATDNLFKNLVAQQKSSSWECDSCLTRNNGNETKCLCCETPKPGTKDTTKAALSTSTVIAPKADDLFKSLAEKQKKTQWECDACMTKNDPSKDSCACCETPKAGSKPAPKLAPSSTFTFGMPATQPTPNSDDLFKNLAAQQKKSQWECDACMSRNDASKDKCASCETPKPGSKPAAKASSSLSFGMNSTVSSTAPTFSFGMPSTISTPPSVADEGFKKLVEKQNSSWECSACLTRNEPSKMKCLCCEQAKPGSSPATPHFSFGSKLTSSVTLPATSEIKFSFGMSAAAKVDPPAESKIEKATKELNDEVDKPKTFSFGVNNSSLIKETTKLPEVSAANSVTAPLFTFKTPSPNVSAPPSFTSLKPAEVVEEKKEEVKEVAKTPLFSFGATPAIPAVEKPKALIPEPAKPKEEMKKSSFGEFSMSGNDSAAAKPPAFGNSLNSNGGFSFGGFSAKPVESVIPTEPVKASQPALPSAPGGFSFGASTNTMSFNNSASMITTASTPATNSFVFGASKTESETTNTFGGFGASSSAINSNSAKPAFGANVAQSAPVFGQSSPGGFSFSAKKEEAAPAQPSLFAFGAKPAAATNPPMLFGNNQSSQNQSATPSFGASSTFGANVTPSFGASSATPSFGGSSAPSFGGSSAPAFGGSSAPSFGSPGLSFGAPNNNNNESGFGSKMPAFSNTNQPQKRAAEHSQGNAEMSQNKKFDFGVQQQQANSFQLNAQGTETKQAFNFSTTAPTSFNFTNASANNSQAPATAPIMQFNAMGSSPSMTVPGIASFTAQSSGPSTAGAANQRKILRAQRRTMPRR